MQYAKPPPPQNTGLVEVSFYHLNLNLPTMAQEAGTELGKVKVKVVPVLN
jgi:hypothetical protein